MKAVNYIQHLENENELLTDDTCRLNNSIDRYERLNINFDSDSDTESISSVDTESISSVDTYSISSVDVAKNLEVVVDVKQNDNLLLAINSVLNTSIILLTIYSVFSLLKKH